MPTATFAQRLFTLTGLVPLGAFALLHVVEQALAILGGAGTTQPGLPSLLARALLLWAPLAFHSLYGIALWIRRDPSGTSTAGAPADADQGPLRLLGRATGLIALAFVIWHAAEFRGAAIYERADPATVNNDLYATLSSTQFGAPLVAAGYLLGLFAVAFHLGYGSFRALSTLGYTRSTVAQRRLKQAITGLCVCWLVLGVVTVLHAATGTALPF